jgi:signal peptidase II
MLSAHHPLMSYGLAGIVAGALGNLADRVFRGDGWLRGKVVDFIDLQWFPVFNVADSCITLGAIAVIVGLFVEQNTARKDAEAS